MLNLIDICNSSVQMHKLGRHRVFFVGARNDYICSNMIQSTALTPEIHGRCIIRFQMFLAETLGRSVVS